MNGARRLAYASLVVLCVLATGGCGVSDPSAQTFAFTGIGPEGGQVLVGDVLLVIPQGALTQPTAVDVAPQAAPLPITKPGADPCTYAFLGPIWCCGPVGQELNVPAFIRLAYDENLIPAGKTEADLVLLVWDDPSQTMQPLTVGVVHSVAGNYFETYLSTLGHVAVGVRTCLGPVRPIVFAGGNIIPLVQPSGLPVPPDGLYLATADNSQPIVGIPTDGELPDTWVPSPAGDRILYQVFFPQSEDQILRTVGVDDDAPVTVVDFDRQITGSDPLLGWWRDAVNVFFFEFVTAESTGGAGSISSEALSRVPGDGSALPSPVYFISTSEFVDDMRQSDDGTRVLLQIVSFVPEFALRIDVLDAATGAQISSGVIPTGGGHATPRFVPGSTDVYVVNFQRDAVERYTDAGVLVDTIYSLGGEDFSDIVDFVLAPGDTDAYAAVLEEPFSETFLTIDGQDTLEVGTLSEGSAGAVALGTFGAFVDEMIFHPNGQHVILDMLDVRVFSAADATQESLLPVQSMSDVDVHRDDGQLLLVLKPARQGASPPIGGTLADGLYVATEDGAELTPIDAQGLQVLSARWLFGIRTAPGIFRPHVR